MLGGPVPYELSLDPRQALVGMLLKLEAVKCAQVWCTGLHSGFSSNWKNSFVPSAGTVTYVNYLRLLGQTPLAQQ